MPVDSATKRASALSFGTGIALPVPDASVGDDDKLHMLLLYAGISPDSFTLPDLEFDSEIAADIVGNSILGDSPLSKTSILGPAPFAADSEMLV